MLHHCYTYKKLKRHNIKAKGPSTNGTASPEKSIARPELIEAAVIQTEIGGAPTGGLSHIKYGNPKRLR